MQKISREDFITTDWLRKGNNAFLLRIEDGLIFPLAEIEVWEDCPNDTDRYRILEYWKWCTPINDLLQQNTIEGAMLIISGRESSITINEERDGRNVYEDLAVSNPVIFGMDEHEIQDILPYLTNGKYIILTNW